MLAEVRFSHIGQQPDPETVEQAFHLFSTEGYLVLPEIFPTALIDKLHSSFLATYSRYCTHENHTDALLVGNRRVMVTVRLEGP
ncbi:phytanoyl-CoA dioxygenase, partial [Synechococcus sp. OH2]